MGYDGHEGGKLTDWRSINMFTSTPQELINQSKEIADEIKYYKAEYLSFSTFKSMDKCAANHLLGEPPEWDQDMFMIGHGAEIMALEGEEAFNKWLNSDKIKEVAYKQPSQASLKLYSDIETAFKFHESQDKDNFKLLNGKKPTKTQKERFERLVIDECKGKLPEYPQPTLKPWVEQAKICGKTARLSPWLNDLTSHKDTLLQETICFQLDRVKWKGRLDLINPTEGIILDFKTVGYKLDRNIWEQVKIDGRTRNVRINFVEDQRYLLQAAIYIMAAYIRYGEIFEYYIACIEKSELPRFEILHIPYEDIQPYFQLVQDKMELFYSMILKEIKPFSCGKHTCKYCAPRRKVKKPINWREV